MFRDWLIALFLCVLVCGASILFLDRLVASLVHHHPLFHDILGHGAMKAPIIQGVALVLLIFGGTRRKDTSNHAAHRSWLYKLASP